MENRDAEGDYKLLKDEIDQIIEKIKLENKIWRELMESESKIRHKKWLSNPLMGPIIGVVIGAVLVSLSAFFSNYAIQHFQHHWNLTEMDRKLEIEIDRNRLKMLEECVNEFSVLSTFPQEARQIVKYNIAILKFTEGHKELVSANYQIIMDPENRTVC